MCVKQFPEFVLDRLAFPVRPALAERRLRALAFLGALVQLYTGGHRLKVDPQRGGIRQLCTRMHVQVVKNLTVQPSWWTPLSQLHQHRVQKTAWLSLHGCCSHHSGMKHL